MADLPNALSASDAARRIKEGSLRSVDLVQACLQRIDETDGQLRAWAHIDAALALSQAEEMDQIRRSGRAVGPLHGVPVGLKDIIDVSGLPCTRGTPIHDGRTPKADAAIVERLREAGAVILGKTKTTEFAFVHPTDTANPHNPAHSPGGSSSGSAAAVAAYQVPLAVGTQTNGSVIRPASFCGVYGFKPTRGIIPRRGVLQTSEHLDQIGVFARSMEDAALLTDVIGFYDPSDMLSFARPRPYMRAGARADAPVEPDFVWFDLPYHDRLSDDAREGFDELLQALGPRVQRVTPDANLTGLIEVQQCIHEYEFVHNLDSDLSDHWDRLSDTLKPVVERGRTIARAQYEDALAVKASAESFFADFFNDYDAILAPAASGEAPLISSGHTGDPVFCTLWTTAGLPCLTLPFLSGASGLPIGVQLVGGAEEDDRLMRTAAWLHSTLDIEPHI